jgi:hypothetical protein
MGDNRMNLIKTLDIKVIGYVENPFRQGKIRNKFCPCMSGKKVKVCCGDALYIDKEYLDSLLYSMKVREENATAVQDN